MTPGTGWAGGTGRSSPPKPPDGTGSGRYFRVTSRRVRGQWPFVQWQDTRLWIWEWWFESTRANCGGSPHSPVALVYRPETGHPGGNPPD